MRLRPSLVLLVTLCGAPSVAAEVTLDAGLQLMLRMLTYDSTFKARGTGDFLVLVPYDEGTRYTSRDALGAGARVNPTLRARPLSFLAVPVEELDEAITRRGAAAVLLPVGLGAEATQAALRVARTRSVYALAWDEKTVRGGALLGVVDEGGRPRVVINTDVAKQIGADFAPAVMRVARTVR